MPPRSKRQTRFMYAVAEGKVKGSGLTRQQAREFVADTPKGLPETAPKRRKRKGAR